MTGKKLFVDVMFAADSPSASPFPTLFSFLALLCVGGLGVTFRADGALMQQGTPLAIPPLDPSLQVVCSL
jgi:hypothetical protein